MFRIRFNGEIRFIPIKKVFLPIVPKCHIGFFGFFLSDIVGFLLHRVKGFGMTVVIWHYINQIKLKKI